MKRIIVLIFSLLTLGSSPLYAQSWSPVDSGIKVTDYAIFWGVFTLQTYNGNLYAGGQFSAAGNIPSNCIAQWNNIAWDSVNTGISGSSFGVNALTIYNGDLFAGGLFSKAGNISAHSIAQWNGLAWDSLHSGITSINGVVYTLAVYNGKLYVGGNFTSAGGIAANNIAVWDGTNWDSVGGGISGDNEVLALAVYNGKLYAGGHFIIVGGIHAKNIASWDGTNWDSVGGGVSNVVKALAVYGDTLYVGGWFDSAGGKPAKKIAMWNGVKWNSVGNMITTYKHGPQINALYVYNDNLYAGGQFDTIGNIPAYSVAYWDRTNWHSAGQGVVMNKIGGIVLALGEYNGALYVCGAFDTAGGNTALNIARWITPTGIDKISSNSGQLTVYPNPSKGVFTVTLSHAELVSASQTIEIYNEVGQKIYNATLNPPTGGQGDNSINIGNQPNGIYLYRVLEENGNLAGEGKIIIQK